MHFYECAEQPAEFGKRVKRLNGACTLGPAAASACCQRNYRDFSLSQGRFAETGNGVANFLGTQDIVSTCIFDLRVRGQAILCNSNAARAQILADLFVALAIEALAAEQLI